MPINNILPQEDKFKSKPKIVLREGVFTSDLEGLFLGGQTVRFSISDNRCHSSIYKQRVRKVLSGAGQVCVYLGSYMFSFGKGRLMESSLGGILLDFGIVSFKDDDIVVGLDFVFRDKHGDKEFSCVVELVLLYFK